jgi:hypothetical protein
MNKTNLDTSTLRDALAELELRYTLDEIQKASETNNLSRILRGVAGGRPTEPTKKTWWKLHDAFPAEIPPPSYVDGRTVYKSQSVSNSSNVNQAGRDNNIGQQLPPMQQTIVDLLNEHDESGRLAMDTLAFILQQVKK